MLDAAIGSCALESWLEQARTGPGLLIIDGLLSADTRIAGRTVTELPAYRFEVAAGARLVADAIGVLNLQGFGLAPDHPALGPAGALVAYATDNLCAKPENLRGLQEYRSEGALLLDPATQRNLEIFASVRGGRPGSLLAAMDATATAAGYSHSYRTDGSGYALIYLNGPSPGAQITVTVGGATCTTSD